MTAEAAAPRLLWRFAPLVVFAALGVVFAYMLFNNSGGTLRSTLLGRPAPEFQLALLDRSGAPDGGRDAASGALSNADLRTGKVSVLNLWASWCAPCRVEHPQLMALAARDDVAVYGIAFQDEPKNARAFLQELGDPFAKVGLDPEGQESLKWGVEGVPETFLIDGSGRVLLKHTGQITPEHLKTIFLPAIERAKLLSQGAS